MSRLFTPYTIANMTLKNRIVMSSMCMYSCTEDGKVTNWHRTHYTSRAVGQSGLIIMEATAIAANGRISYEDLGIWNDSQIEGLKELVKLSQEQDAKVGIQLNHAGRKARLEEEIIAPSAIPFSEEFKLPKEMTIEDIHNTIELFAKAAERAKEADFDVIELHAAHGYLINQFLSPLSNKRNDEYGGNLSGRYLFLRQVIEAVQKVWNGPLFVRISANDYHPQGSTIEDYVQLAKEMKRQGVDLIDCSSGGVLPVAQIEQFPGYQVPFAERIKQEAGIAAGAVGLITEACHAEEILSQDQADLIFLARALLRNPYWPRLAAEQLGDSIQPPKPYERGWIR